MIATLLLVRALTSAALAQRGVSTVGLQCTEAPEVLILDNGADRELTIAGTTNSYRPLGDR